MVGKTVTDLALAKNHRELALIDQASQALSEAETVQDKKKVLDDMAMLCAIAKRRGASAVAVKAGAMEVVAAREIGSMLKGNLKPGKKSELVPKGHQFKSLDELGIKKKQSSRWQKVAAVPEKSFQTFIDKAVTSETVPTTAGALKLYKEVKRGKKAARKAEVPDDLPAKGELYNLIVGDMAKVNGEVPAGEVDWIITDPPYPKEFLPVYVDLAKFGARVLKPGASMLVMVGQSYLPDILAAMTPHIRYHWTLAYLTPGGQSVQLWDRAVNTFWKPVLWFTNGEPKSGRRKDADWVGDVCKSDVNDNDKDHHHWGQSESGMADLIERFTYPGELIVDPFLGGGTTGVVAVEKNRRFIGIDIDAKAIETTKERLAAFV